MPSSTGRAAIPAQPGPGVPPGRPPGTAPLTPASPRPDPGQPAANWPATAALACGILGGALITIPAGLVLAGLGFRRARQGARGLVRCWLAVALTLAWAGAAGYLVPHLLQAADPGCVAYKNTALTAYNRVADDVSDGRTRVQLDRDLAGAITTIGAAAADSRSAAASRSLAALSGDLRAMRADVQACRDVPRGLLLSLNRETRDARHRLRHHAPLSCLSTAPGRRVSPPSGRTGPWQGQRVSRRPPGRRGGVPAGIPVRPPPSCRSPGSPSTSRWPTWTGHLTTWSPSGCRIRPFPAAGCGSVSRASSWTVTCWTGRPRAGTRDGWPAWSGWCHPSPC